LKAGRVGSTKMALRHNRMLGKCLQAILWGACLLSLTSFAWSQETAEWKIRVSAEKAIVRLNPGSESPIIASLPKGTTLNSYAAEGDWFRVVLPPGKDGTILIGYIAKSDVEILEQKITKERNFWQAEEEGFKGIGLQMTLSAGWSLFPSGDIDKGAKGLYNIGADAIAARGVNILGRSIKPFRSAFNMSGDVIFNLGPKIGIGITVGYIHSLGIDTFQYSERVFQNTMNSATELTIVALRMGAFYTLPLGRLLKLRLNAGPAVFMTNLVYSRNAQGLDFEENYTLKVNATNFGFQGGAALEIRLLERVFLFFEIQGRSAKISDFKGSEHWEGRENTELIPTINKEGTLYFVPENPYPRLAVFPEGSSDALGAHKAVFDFAGADFLAGLHLRF
jgi:Bacterial SH3 domain